METVSTLLAICAGNSPVPGEFPEKQRPVTRCFDVFFDLRLNKRLSKQSWGWWFETYRTHYDVTVMLLSFLWMLQMPLSIFSWLSNWYFGKFPKCMITKFKSMCSIQFNDRVWRLPEWYSKENRCFFLILIQCCLLLLSRGGGVSSLCLQFP